MAALRRQDRRAGLPRTAGRDWDRHGGTDPHDHTTPASPLPPPAPGLSRRDAVPPLPPAGPVAARRRERTASSRRAASPAGPASRGPGRGGAGIYLA